MSSSGASHGGSMSGESLGELNIDENKPLWNHVTKLGKSNEGGGNIAFKCNYCHTTFKGTYSRVKAHLLKISGYGIKVCPKVNSSQLNEIQRQVNEAELRMKRIIPKVIPLPTSYSSSASISSSGRAEELSITVGSLRQQGFEPKKRKGVGDTPLEKAFNMQTREHLDDEIARMFYSAGLPFNLARNPRYKNAFTFACNNNLADYIPPGYNAIRSKLLEKERSHIEKLLEPTKGIWKEKGVTLVCDGWTDPQRRPLINFMAVSKNYSMFLKAVNCEGGYKDRYFISNLIKEVIMMVGPSNVVQVITDNAPVCRAAGLLVEQNFPHIFWTPCVVHTLNLTLKNICAAKNTEANEATYNECHWITVIAGDAVQIRNFIMNHSMRLSIFNDFSSLKMLVVAETRFASVIVMLRRYKQIKNALQAMVISEKWSCYREDDVGNARFVKEKLLDDLWWDSIDYILSFTDPIYDMLRIADTNKSCLKSRIEDRGSRMTTAGSISFVDAELQNVEEDYTILWNHSLSYIKSMCLKCVVELRIPDAIHRHGKPATIADLLSSLSIPEAKSRFLRTMMRLLSNQRIFKTHITLSGEEAFELSPVSRLLTSSAPHRLSSSPFVLLMLDQNWVAPCHQLSRWFYRSEAAITPFEVAHQMPCWDYIQKLPEFSDLFNKAMASDSTFVSDSLTRVGRESFQGIRTLVDVGGGTGSLAAALVEAFPGLKCTVLDLPTVVTKAKKTDGIQFIGGDMFTEIPPADVALLKSILHDWGDEECVKILQRCKEAIPSKQNGGKVIIIDMVVGKGVDNKTSLETQLLYDLKMMILTTGKERDEDEWHKLFVAAGFNSYKITSSVGLRSVIEVYP